MSGWKLFTLQKSETFQRSPVQVQRIENVYDTPQFIDVGRPCATCSFPLFSFLGGLSPYSLFIFDSALASCESAAWLDFFLRPLIVVICTNYGGDERFRAIRKWLRFWFLTRGLKFQWYENSSYISINNTISYMRACTADALSNRRKWNYKKNTKLRPWPCTSLRFSGALWKLLHRKWKFEGPFTPLHPNNR